MNQVIRIGTRKSGLALIQSGLVADALRRIEPDLEIRLVTRETLGDRILDKPLQEFGGKGVFVTELEEGIREGTIDLAVHSAKDLPMELAKGLSVVGVLPREDPRDVLVTMAGSRLEGKGEIVIGSSSPRRKLQIEELGKGLWPGSTVRCETLRGNVQTRLQKLSEGLYDGVLLAAAGLKRLGISDLPQYHYRYFDCETFVPAGGQGILAVEGRADGAAGFLCRRITDEITARCFRVEREVLKRLGAGCHEPVGVYARPAGRRLELFGIGRSGDEIRRIHLAGEPDELDELTERAVKGLS